MLKRQFKMKCLITSEFNPSDRSRDWLCMTLITPKQEGLTTLCVDEKIYNKVLRRLSVGMGGSLCVHTHFNMAENRDKKNSNIARALPQHKRRPIC